ncbi:MAG: SDR family oxidoreductase [Oscillospiraceae bacterium]
MKTAYIIGASGGIGAACARRLAATGWRIAAHYHTNETAVRALGAELAAQGADFYGFRADLTAAAEVFSAFEGAARDFGAPELLVVCAGVSHSGVFNAMAADEIDRILAVNLNGALYAARAAVPAMVSQKRGNIIFISSMWGETGASCEAVYSAAKAGLIGFSKALAKELAPCAIRVNCIAPGFIDTAMNAALSEDERAAFFADVPLARAGTPEEVADAVEFISSDRASYITGEVLRVNGGFVI